MCRLFFSVLAGLLLSALLQAAEPDLTELEQATRRTPASVEAWDRYGMALAHQQRYSEALRAIEHAASLKHADTKHLHYHLALVTAWSGDYTAAVERYATLLNQFPSEHDWRVDYGQALAWAKRYAEAESQYRQVLASQPRHIEALRHLGVLLGWQGNYDGALQQLKTALAAAPDNPRLMAERAEIFAWKGDLNAAARDYENLLKLEPDKISHQLKLAQVYAWQGRTRPAREAYLAILARAPETAAAHAGLVQVYLDNHQYRDAEKQLRIALEIFPADPLLRRALTELGSKRTLDWRDIADQFEPLLFAAILLVLARHIWRYRRILKQHRIARFLLPALPTLAVLMIAVDIFIIYGTTYFHEISTATQVLEFAALLALLLLVLTLVWLLRFEQPAKPSVVLAIGAHPDDIEFGCGATLLRLREQGATTIALILTAGEQGNETSRRVPSRVHEARRAARIMGLNDIEFRDFPDTRLHEHKEAIRQAIELAIRIHRPDIIFTHNAHDVHTDHRTVHEATREAARGPCTVLCYENPNTPSTFTPTYFSDAGQYLADKISALLQHKSQMGKSYADPAIVRATAAFRGTQARIELAEGFEVLRVLV